MGKILWNVVFAVLCIAVIFELGLAIGNDRANSVVTHEVYHVYIAKSKWIRINATTFNAEPCQTAVNPYICSSGFRINKVNPESDSIIGMSRDLLANFSIDGEFHFGDKVAIIGGADFPYNGIYRVETTTTAEYRGKKVVRTVDFLVNKASKMGYWSNVYITKMTDIL